MKKFLSKTTTATVISMATMVGVMAQTAWPDRAIKVIVPYTPGGGTDAVTRHLLDKVAVETKWSLIVDNKPGGGGNVGLDMVAKSKPDGYTLGMGQTANLAINPALMPKMPFDPVKDLIPVALVAELPTILVVRQDSTFKNLGDIVKFAKSKPGSLKQALAGTGTVGHLAGEMLAVKAGFTVLDVPYKGQPQQSPICLAVKQITCSPRLKLYLE